MSGKQGSSGRVVGAVVVCCILGAVGYHLYVSGEEGPVTGAQPNALVEDKPAATAASSAPETPAAEPKVSTPLIEEPAQADTPKVAPEPAPEVETTEAAATEADTAEAETNDAETAETEPAGEAGPIPEQPGKPARPDAAAVAAPSDQAPDVPAPAEEAQVASPPQDEEVAATQPQAAETPAPQEVDIQPQFDLIRIDRSGAGLIAGRATPDTDIEIVNEGSVVGRARTGRDGAFVAYIAVDPGIAAQELTAQAAGDRRATATVSAPVVVVASTEEDAAPVIFQPSEEGVRLIQPTSRPDDASVTLDSISYDAEGIVTFAGRAQQAAAIRLYLDGTPTLETRAADDGSWRASVGEAIAPGVYTLRVDQLDETGAVTSRIETPFLREQITEGELGENQLTVQTGNNLWKLAEGIYGAGTRYTLIYQANRDSIRDPDLIYPGQIFKLPDAPRAR